MVSWANHIQMNNVCGSVGISRILRITWKMKTFRTSLILKQTKKRLTLMRNNYCRYCSYNHCHIVGTRTPYLSRPPAPTRSILFTNRKSANSQGVRTNCAFQHWMWERGCVWANDLWQWLWVQRGTLRVKCLAQERNVSSQGSNQNLSVQSSANANNEAFRPPTIT